MNSKKLLITLIFLSFVLPVWSQENTNAESEPETEEVSDILAENG